MHKVSGLFFAAAALTALAAVLLMGGCKQQITPSTLITKQVYPNGTDAVPIPKDAQRAPDNTPADQPNPTTPGKATAPKGQVPPSSQAPTNAAAGLAKKDVKVGTGAVATAARPSP